MKELKKHVFLFLVFVKYCLMGYLEYRANFFMEFISEIAYILVKVIYIVAIYQTDVSFTGIDPAFILILGGNYMILTGLFVGFFMMNFLTISDHIKNGTLDWLIVKPVSLQFMVTFKNFQLGSAIPNFIGGVIVFIIGINKINVSITYLHIIFYIVLMVSAIVLMYSVFLILQLPAFWIVKTDALNNMLEIMWDNNNMPMKIYGKWIVRFGIFIIPIFVISNFPVMGILSNINEVYFMWAIIAPILFLKLSIKLWNISVKRYSSASS